MSMRTIHTEKYTLLIAAPLKVREQWRVAMNEAADPEFSFLKGKQVAYRSEDSFDLRDDFLAIGSAADAFRFFEHYGPFQYAPDKEKPGNKNPEAQPSPIKWSEIQKAQKDFEEALLADGIPVERRWLFDFVFGQPLSVEIPFRAVSPTLSRIPVWKEDAAIAACDDVVDALRASIFLSRMRGFTWKRCARRGCNLLFEQATKRQRLYCGDNCAHLQAVNDYNARHKKKSRSTARKRSTKRG